LSWLPAQAAGLQVDRVSKWTPPSPPLASLNATVRVAAAEQAYAGGRLARVDGRTAAAHRRRPALCITGRPGHLLFASLASRARPVLVCAAYDSESAAPTLSDATMTPVTRAYLFIYLFIIYLLLTAYA